MFDTNIVIVGNVLTAPEWRRTTNTNSLVANFKVASTARRLNRETGQWVDGNSLRVRVNCWRKLAEGVASSIMVGDPVIVAGRLYTRDWTDADGNQRTMYEMEAVAVGHDLARGRSSFKRNRPTLGTSAVESPETDGQVRGEAAEPVADGDVPVRYGEGLLDDEEPQFGDVPPAAPADYDPIAAIRGGGFEPFDAGTGSVTPVDDDFDADRPEPHPDPDPAPAPQAPARAADAADGDAAVPGSGGGNAPADPGEAVLPRRPRRNGRRIPVPA